MPTCGDIIVLVVDDEASFRSGVAANLADDGHVVHEHAAPAEVASDRLHEVDVIVTHFHMAEADGIAFADAVHDLRPGIPVLLVTAYWTVEVEAAAAVRPYVHLYRRPIDYDDLHARIHAVAVAI